MIFCAEHCVYLNTDDVLELRRKHADKSIVHEIFKGSCFTSLLNHFVYAPTYFVLVVILLECVFHLLKPTYLNFTYVT